MAGRRRGGRRGGRRVRAAVAAPLPPVLERSSDDWDLGNPNKIGVVAQKKTASKPRLVGVPKEEYVTIELTDDYWVADERANRASTKFVKYLNQIKNARIQIFETAFEMTQKKGKDERPGKPELVHMKVALKDLMNQMAEKLAAVHRDGGIPVPAPPHFKKSINV